MDPDICRRGSLSTSCFKAGDGRLVEQPALTSLHVVFLRLHNRIATKLAALNAHWSDEKLFQESRRIVAAIVQHITYREFLPIVLGKLKRSKIECESHNSLRCGNYISARDPSKESRNVTIRFRSGRDEDIRAGTAERRILRGLRSKCEPDRRECVLHGRLSLRPLPGPAQLRPLRQRPSAHFQQSVFEREIERRNLYQRRRNWT